jgi:hypothetical protein
LERLIEKVSDPIACGRDDHDLEHDNAAFWRSVVTTILTELREPSDALDDAGRARYYGVPKFRDDPAMDDGDSSAIFTAMIDAILEGKA